ncbi:MAG TPA: metallophosphoesterase family protein [Phycisphaerales bacterium]|nr:metallophosphoesterase family protein [Phycisphaerales bacterium]
MNRFGVISDIHGNMHAMQAVMARLTKMNVDQILCLGDIVGYGPFPDACLDMVVKHCKVIVQGNHDQAVVDPVVADEFNGAAREAIYWTRDALGPLHLNALNRLRKTALVGQKILCVHDNPAQNRMDYVHDAEMAAISFRGMDRHICLIGHTHVPVVFEAPSLNPDEQLTAPEVVTYSPQDGKPITLDPERRYICNPGSVGQPRDSDPRASFAVLDLNEQTFTVFREMYDIEAAQMATQRAGLPFVLAERLALGA